MSVTVVAALLVLSAGCVARRREGALRVHAGQPDSRNVFPFIVVFQTTRPPILRGCSGSLIAANWVLTASHCLTDPFNRVIRYGDFSLPPNETKLYRNVIKAFRHPTYNNRDDIGLVLIEKILDKPIARLLALDYKTLFGVPVKYAGFGLTTKRVEPRLQVILPMLSDLRFPPRVGEGVIGPCAGFDSIDGLILCVAAKCSNRKEAPRQADSGGPLVYGGRVIGMAKAINFHQGAFTPVSIYLQWIQAVMRSNS